MLGVATNPSAMRPARRAPGGVPGTDPQRGRWVLVGAGSDVQVFQMVVLAVEGEGFSGPALADDFHAFLEPANPLADRNLEGAEVGILVPEAHAEDDPSLGDQVEGYHVLGQVHGIVQGKQNDRGADVQGGGAGGDRRGDDQGEGRNPSLS